MFELSRQPQGLALDVAHLTCCNDARFDPCALDRFMVGLPWIVALLALNGEHAEHVYVM